MKTKSLSIIKQLKIWGFGILCSVHLLHADQINILTPAGSDHVEGNTQVSWEEYSSRYQQVFDASLFKPSMPNGGWIQIAYLRADGPSFQPNFGELTGAEVTLSTTTKGVDSLSPVFADNIGSDVKVLLSRSQTISFSAPSFNPLGVRSYGPILYYSPSSSPPASWMFFYDPSKGNLLIDFKNIRPTLGSGGNASLLTLDATTSPLMSSVSGGYTPDNPNPTSGTLSSKGLVMLFKVTPVPEPSAYALCAVGILGLILHPRHNNNRKDSHVAV